MRKTALAAPVGLLEAGRDAASACAWTGSAGTAWDDPANWSACAGTTPQSADTASIPAAPPNQPVLSRTESISSFSLAAGATLAVSGTLTIFAASTVELFIRPGLPGRGFQPSNYNAGKIRANNAIARIGAAVSVFCGQATGTTHLIIDVNGYFQ